MQTRTIRARASKGFTLLELLVVMVIVGLLSGYVGPMLFKHLGKSKTNAAQAQIDGLSKALEHYRLDVGQYPTTAEGLEALVNRPPGLAKWDGSYLTKGLPQDPWGRPYQYRSPGEHGAFDLLSLGKDGRAGGDGEDADVVSW